MKQNTLNNLQFSALNIVTFETSGTYTPPANLLFADVVCTGGGGGSGGNEATGAGESASAGEGGGGAVCRQVFSRADLMPNVVVTVGAGGTAGAAGNNPGGNGGTTTFLTLSAGGGNGSAGGPAGIDQESDGALGGIATGGAINIGGPRGATSGVKNTTPFVPLYGSPTYTITGFGQGANANLRGPMEIAEAGGSGQSGQVTITEYLGV